MNQQYYCCERLKDCALVVVRNAYTLYGLKTNFLFSQFEEHGFKLCVRQDENTIHGRATYGPLHKFLQHCGIDCKLIRGITKINVIATVDAFLNSGKNVVLLTQKASGDNLAHAWQITNKINGTIIPPYLLTTAKVYYDKYKDQLYVDLKGINLESDHPNEIYTTELYTCVNRIFNNLPGEPEKLVTIQDIHTGQQYYTSTANPLFGKTVSFAEKKLLPYVLGLSENSPMKKTDTLIVIHGIKIRPQLLQTRPLFKPFIGLKRRLRDSTFHFNNHNQVTIIDDSTNVENFVNLFIEALSNSKRNYNVTVKSPNGNHCKYIYHEYQPLNDISIKCDGKFSTFNISYSLMLKYPKGLPWHLLKSYIDMGGYNNCHEAFKNITENGFSLQTTCSQEKFNIISLSHNGLYFGKNPWDEKQYVQILLPPSSPGRIGEVLNAYLVEPSSKMSVLIQERVEFHHISNSFSSIIVGDHQFKGPGFCCIEFFTSQGIIKIRSEVPNEMYLYHLNFDPALSKEHLIEAVSYLYRGARKVTEIEKKDSKFRVEFDYYKSGNDKNVIILKK